VTAEQAGQLVNRIARQMWIGRAAKTALLVGAVGAVLGVWGLLVPGADMAAILAVVVLWVLASAAGATGARLINVAVAYTGAGRVDLAEEAFADAADRFSLHPAQQLLAVQNLAALAHGAGQYAQATLLSRFLVAQSGRNRRLRRAFDRPARLLLADGELMLGRLREAYEQLTILYVGRQTLAERLALLPVACYYEAAVGWWDGLTSHARGRARMARLLPPAQAASTLACLALGCQHTGRLGRRDWLWQHATLLVDRDELVGRFPLLSDLSAESAIRLPWEQHAPDSGETE